MSTRMGGSMSVGRGCMGVFQEVKATPGFLRKKMTNTVTGSGSAKKLGAAKWAQPLQLSQHAR